MTPACPDTLRLARRLAVVAHLPDNGAVIIVPDPKDRMHYENLILAHRGRKVLSATMIVGADTMPARAKGAGFPVFDDRRLQAAAAPERLARAYPASFTHGDTQLHIGADGVVSTTRL